MHEFEEIDEYDKRDQFIETLWALVQPKSYKKYKDQKDLKREEEGVDQVIYHGEDNWEEIMEDFSAFGMSNIDVFGEGLKLIDEGLR